MKRIIFITHKLPFPRTDGRKNILMQYITQIKSLFPACEITNLSFVEDSSLLVYQPDCIDECVTLKAPGIFEKLFYIIFHTLILRRWPLQVASYFSRRVFQEIKKKVDQKQPDAVIFDMVRVAEYAEACRGLACQTILNYDDLLSLRYKRQMKWVDFTPSVFGGAMARIPAGLRQLVQFKTMQKWILAMESRLLEKYEIQMATRFDHLVFTSPKEAMNFQKTTNHPSSVGIPMVFPVTQTKIGERRYQSNKIVFVGRMDVAHNVSAVLYFIKKIWPNIKKHCKDATFYIVGTSPALDIFRLSRQYPDVVVTGQVDDVKAAVSDAAVFVAPLIYGTGIKTKVIEAMSFGVPVVATSIAMEGLPFKPFQDACVADDYDVFSRFVVQLMNDRLLNEHLSKNGARWVDQYFSPEHANEKWEQILTQKPVVSERSI